MRKFKSVKKGYILLFWYLFSCFPVFMGTWSVGVHWQMFSFVCPSVLSGRLLVGRANQWNWQHLSLSLCTQSIHIAPCYLLDWLWPGYFRLHTTHYHTPNTGACEKTNTSQMYCVEVISTEDELELVFDVIPVCITRWCCKWM